MVRTICAAFALSLLSGCAMSAEGLGRSAPEDTYYSTKPAVELAGCVASRLIGTNPAFQQESGHWVVTRTNGYGVPVVRWDFIDQTDGETRVEFRRSLAPMAGEEKAASCF